MSTENEVVEVEEIEIEETETPAVEEETGEAKPFSEMTEDERLELPDDKLIEELQKEGEEKTETPPEEEVEGKPKEETVEGEEKSLEDKIRDGDAIGHEELEKGSAEQRGRYYALQDERGKRRVVETELEKVKAVQEGQVKIIEKLHDRSKSTDAEPISEYDKVMVSLDAKANAWAEDTGNDAGSYTPTIADQRAIKSAEKADKETADKAQYAEHVEKETARAVQNLQNSIVAGEKALEAAGVKDYKFVYDNFIDKMINPDIADDPDEAIANAQILYNLSKKGKNPAKYAYEHFAQQSEAGQKYFREKKQKKENKELIESGGKKTTKTSAHVEGARTAPKGEKVDITVLNNNFDYWEGKLSSAQFTDVVNGKTLHL